MTSRWEVTKAVRASTLPAPARLVMLVLADVAEVGTAEIPQKFTPSLTVLEHETGLSRSTIKRQLSALEAGGWLVRSYPTSAEMRRGERVRYRLEAPAAGSTQDPEVGSEGGSTVTPGSTENLGGVQGEPRGGSTVNPLIRSVSDQADPKTPTGSSKATTGTRIPDDFAATPDMIAWAREHTPLVGAKETEAFVDYWRSKPGKDGRKTDWVATWRNWMRRAQTTAERGQARASPDGLVELNGHRVRPEFAARAAMRERLAAADAARQAIEGSGP